MPHVAALSPLSSFGHIATHAELLEAFHGRESALLPFRMNYGLISHPRVDAYTCAHLTEIEKLAAWCGGHPDCVTVLAEQSVSVGDAGEPHLRLPRGQGGAAARRRLSAPAAHVHWSRQRTPVLSVDAARIAARGGERPDRLRVPLREALRQAMTTCLSYRQSGEVLEAMGVRKRFSRASARRAMSQPRSRQVSRRGGRPRPSGGAGPR